LRYNGSKPGSCPAKRKFFKQHGKNCGNNCSTDHDCPKRKKCCNIGCGLRCLRPTRQREIYIFFI
uniref:WAP domain-containing protein n=1 Tax=Gouania willdenowi TaxID=441366 RepID=A0A8C5DD49_GOUWI